MAKPISRTFDQTKDSVINVFPEAAKELGMPMIGCNYELGMLSFGEEGKAVFHAHIVEQKDRSTRVEIAPGLSFMKDRPQSEMPTLTIDNIMDKLSTTLKSERNR